MAIGWQFVFMQLSLWPPNINRPKGMEFDRSSLDSPRMDQTLALVFSGPGPRCWQSGEQESQKLQAQAGGGGPRFSGERSSLATGIFDQTDLETSFWFTGRPKCPLSLKLRANVWLVSKRLRYHGGLKVDLFKAFSLWRCSNCSLIRQEVLLLERSQCYQEKTHQRLSSWEGNCE